jgi:transposase
MAFFKHCIAKHPPSSFLSYTSTSFSAYAKGIVFSHNRDSEKLPQINLGCLVSQETMLPIFYVTSCGSIVDKSHLPYMMAYN